MIRAMVTASFISLHLARFDQLRAAGPADPGDRPGLLFCEVGADCRAAGTDPASREAFAFLVVGLHESRASADGLAEDIATVAPWFADAAERWSGLLAPFRTKGESNLIDRTAPARMFDPLVASPADGAPVVCSRRPAGTGMASTWRACRTSGPGLPRSGSR